MNDTERKMVALIAKVLWESIVCQEVSENSIQQLENVANDLGANDIENDDFRY